MDKLILLLSIPILLTSRQGTFNPLSISGCKLWVKADSLVLNDGDLVSTWSDLSGNSHDFTASTTARPTFKTAIQNSRPIVRFDGAANIMSTSGTITTAQPDTVIIVASQTSKTTIGRYFDSGTGGVGRQLLGLQGGAGANGTGFFEAFAGTTVRDATDHSAAFHVLTFIFNGASSNGWLDGTQVLTNVNTGTNANGTSAKLGGDNSGGFLTGDIAEVLIYDTSLSTENRKYVEGYLKTKWATP